MRAHPKSVVDEVVRRYLAGERFRDITAATGVADVYAVAKKAGVVRQSVWNKSLPVEGLAGRRFGRLTVLGLSETRKGNGSNGPKPRTVIAWECRCDCGVVKVVAGRQLQEGTRSCGCAHREAARRLKLRHNGTGTPTFAIWRAAKGRCNPGRGYGRRGLQMCSRWRGDYSAFLADMGARPSGLSLDRIDNNVGYTCGKCDDCRANGWPANCRWATRKVQQGNRRCTVRVRYRGEVRPLTEWCELLRLNTATVRQRLIYGWPPDRAFETPVRRRRQRAVPPVDVMRRTWQSMVNRCHNPTAQAYREYGGRGIEVCDRWRKSFETFLLDMGYRPSDQHSLDRTDNDGPYSPENCRWATPAEQRANRRTPRMHGEKSLLNKSVEVGC